MVLGMLKGSAPQLHRRKIWQAFGARGRTGRWGALTALGATIRAWPADRLAELEPYRIPAPLQERINPASGAWATVDAEDPDYREPEPEQPWRRRIRQLAH